MGTLVEDLELRLCSKEDLITEEKKNIYDMIHSRKPYSAKEVKNLIARMGELKKHETKKNN